MVQLSFSLACAQPVEAELHFAECIVSQLKPAFFSLWQLLPQPVELHVHFADANKGVAFSQFTRFPAGVSSSPRGLPLGGGPQAKHVVGLNVGGEIGT